MRLRTIGLISALVLGLLAGRLPAQAQQPGKVLQIGVLMPGSYVVTTVMIDAFRQALRELGYVAGKNLVHEAAIMTASEVERKTNAKRRRNYC